MKVLIYYVVDGWVLKVDVLFYMVILMLQGDSFMVDVNFVIIDQCSCMVYIIVIDVLMSNGVIYVLDWVILFKF